MSTQSEDGHMIDPLLSLPLIELAGDVPILSETASSKAIRIIEKSGSTLPTRLRKVGDLVVSEVTRELDTTDSPDHFLVTRREIEGIIRKAIRRGATQAALDTGIALQSIHAVEKSIGDLPDFQPPHEK